MLMWSDILNYFQKQERLLALSMVCLQKMKGRKFEPYAQDILRFIEYRHEHPLDGYIQRQRQIDTLQTLFEKQGTYPASSYSEVIPIDREQYNLALLLSSVVTLHRFEILEHLVSFLHETSIPQLRLLSVGVGTGYELKLVYDHLPQAEVWAFDNSSETIQYAKALLDFYQYSTLGLKEETFPLEDADGLPSKYNGLFDGVILCEVLEHLEQPEQALLNLKNALRPQGTLFLTMAVNLAQEDHIYHYQSVNHAREQVLASGLFIQKEAILPATVFPFEEAHRETIFQRGNYLCIASCFPDSTSQ